MPSCRISEDDQCISDMLTLLVAVKDDSYGYKIISRGCVGGEAHVCSLRVVQRRLH
jgi:hypothetical protein